MKRSNFVILIIAVLIATIGTLSIYSSNYQKEGELWQDIYKRQIIWIVIGLVMFIIMSNFNYRRLWDWTYFLYTLTIFLLLSVSLLGLVRLGAQRWLRIGWLNFQPSEFTKLIIVIFLARYFSRKDVFDISLLSSKFGIFRGLILPFIFAAIPIGLIIEQPDLGSAIMIFLLFLAVFFLTGVRLRYLFIFLSIVILSLPFLWQFLRDYQKERLLVFLNPNIDPLCWLYHDSI